MLSDEEKQAIQYYKECNEKDLENYEYLGDVSKKQAKYLELLLNLIKKQSKEIERTNEILIWKQKHEEQLQKEIEELKEYKHDAELTKVACCTAQNCEALNNCIKLERELQNADNKWKDKIKAKIEEVDKYENASIPDFIEYAKEYATQKLQSLLEKE